MTTLSRALQCSQFRPDAELEIVCMIVCKRFYRGADADMLTMVLADEAGHMIEAKTWSTKKAHSVYRMFHDNEVVVLECPPYHLAPPDENYSHATYEVSYGWKLYHWKHNPNYPFEFSNFFNCFTDIDRFHKCNRPAKMLAGLLVARGEGPLKYGHDGEIYARGHFIKLRDAKARIFRALVWECLTNNENYTFALETCKIGCCILLPFAREQDEMYRAIHPSIYTVTTTYPPIVNSECISADVYRALTRIPEDRFALEYNPYVVKQETIGTIGYLEISY